MSSATVESSATSPPDTQVARNLLRLEPIYDGRVVFLVFMSKKCRFVTILRESIGEGDKHETDLNDICRRINNDEFDIFKKREGLLVVEEAGKRFAVGAWQSRRNKSARDSVPDIGANTLAFAFFDRSYPGGVLVVDSNDLANYDIQRGTFAN
jgi:hypothetical protein